MDGAHDGILLTTIGRISLTPPFKRGVCCAWTHTENRFNGFSPYGVFSVSHSGIGEVAKYIAEQEEHHRKWS